MQNRKLVNDVDRVIKDLSKALTEQDELIARYLQCDVSDRARAERLLQEAKKQLPKVVRARHQIKQWADHPEMAVYLKEMNQTLMEWRIKADTRMEKFDKEEKRMNSGMFGKEMSKQDQERANTIAWVQDLLQEARRKKEESEVGEEGKKKSRGGKKTDSASQLVEGYNHHITNLELVLRGLNNDLLEADEVDELRQDITDDIEHQMLDPTLYEVLDLNARLGAITVSQTPSTEADTLRSNVKAPTPAPVQLPTRAEGEYLRYLEQQKKRQEETKSPVPHNPVSMLKKPLPGSAPLPKSTVDTISSSSSRVPSLPAPLATPPAPLATPPAPLANPSPFITNPPPPPLVNPPLAHPAPGTVWPHIRATAVHDDQSALRSVIKEQDQAYQRFQQQKRHPQPQSFRTATGEREEFWDLMISTSSTLSQLQYNELQLHRIAEIARKAGAQRNLNEVLICRFVHGLHLGGFALEERRRIIRIIRSPPNRV